MKVKFNRERGVDVGGLRRELVNCFWDEFEKMMDGFQEKVPQVLPSNLFDYYQIGCFIPHVYVMTGFFPVDFFSAKVILCGISAVSDDELVSAFQKFIDPFEGAALQQCMDGQLNSMDSVVTPMLSRFNVLSLPSRESLLHLLVKAARYAFIAKPFFAVRKGMHNLSCGADVMLAWLTGYT